MRILQMVKNPMNRRANGLRYSHIADCITYMRDDNGHPGLSYKINGLASRFIMTWAFPDRTNILDA